MTMDIITLNNNAVDLMQQGNFQKAISVFRGALRELLHHVADDLKEDMDLADKVARTFLPVRSVPLGDSLSLFKSSSYQDHHAFSIFDRALVIDSIDFAASYSSIAGQNCASAVILFNMGLAYQLLGMQELRSQQRSFKKAMKLYEMASNILQNSDDEVDGLTSLAVSNNMGHIFSHFCETRETQLCLDLLQAGLHAIQSSDAEVLEDEYRPFHMNVLILHGQALGAAAAA
jgi:tetratricopeptide (TPR) repeat protein